MEPPRDKHWRPLPHPQRRATLRQWDREAIETAGIPGVVLMENAGAGAALAILELSRRDPATWRAPVLVWCGPGNNGGDGLVVARYLDDAGLDVRVRVPPAIEYPHGSEAAVHFDVVRRLGLPLADISPAELAGAGMVVDALFGIGLSRPLAAPWLDWVRALNASGRPVVALDIPSGLDADTGDALGEAVRARCTLSFAAAKVGFAHGVGPDRCGTVRVVDIGIPGGILAGESASEGRIPRRRGGC